MFSDLEHYRWLVDTSVTTSRYFKLVCVLNGKEVLSKDINELAQKEPETLVREVKFEHAKAEVRKQHPSNAT
jgi:hypothetical protein